MKYILLLALFLCTGCAVCFNPAHKQQVAPAVSTANVINTLTDTKQVLAEAGESNTVVGQKIDKALTLAERLDTMLAQIEAESAKNADKNVIKPE